MWARGYFCATVGAVDEATIKAYIENCQIPANPLRNRAQMDLNDSIIELRSALRQDRTGNDCFGAAGLDTATDL